MHHDSWEVDAEDLWLYREFKASLSYTRACLNKIEVTSHPYSLPFDSELGVLLPGHLVTILCVCCMCLIHNLWQLRTHEVWGFYS